MKTQFKTYLFNKNVLVGDDPQDPENAFAAIVSLSELFGIRVTAGRELACSSQIRLASKVLGIDVPEPFYRGFPQSVRALSPDELLFDQLVSYFITYGLGDFTEPSHSLLEEQIERCSFQETYEVKEFVIVDEQTAVDMLAAYVDDLLASSRPLSEEQYLLVLGYLTEYGYQPAACASKNTAMRLLLDTRNASYARFLALSDVIKLVDELNYRDYHNEHVTKLNLKNQDRKFITAVIDTLIAGGSCNIASCCERKAQWAGLLHHIHYKPASDEARHFVNAMRGKENLSAYSAFQKAMDAGDVGAAFEILRRKKGAGAVLRNLDYLASRCTSEEELAAVASCIESGSAVLLIQLLLKYAMAEEDAVEQRRTFAFTRHNKLSVHHETDDEARRRKSRLTAPQRELLAAAVRDALEQTLSGRLGKVYIDPHMAGIALPLQETASQGGYGSLPRGSRIHLPEGKKIRAFTYWERVNDIDLSVFALDEQGSGQREFSWRSMWDRQSPAITYSGDQTSGYDGGSEYFDINIKAFKRRYPTLRYLVFCDNVYSGGRFFSGCLCRAGYMLRDEKDSGQVFEPKTVQSSWAVTCSSRFAYLFAMDLERRDLIWLNMARESQAAVAGTTSMGFLTRYFEVTDVISVASFFEMMASELVDTPQEADVVVSDEDLQALALPETTEVIRSNDVERIMALMNA